MFDMKKADIVAIVADKLENGQWQGGYVAEW